MFDNITLIVPVCFWNRFPTAADFHSYGTRQVSQYRRPLRVSTRSVFSSRHALPALWNGLPSLLKNELDRTDFPFQLCRHCLYEYELFYFEQNYNYNAVLICWWFEGVVTPCICVM